MVDEIRVVNYTNTGTITLNRDDADYLIDDDGLDWGQVKTSFSTIDNFDGVGASLNAMTSNPREISIVGWVIGNEDEMKIKKALLSQVFAPNCRLKLFIKNKPPLDPEAQYDEKEYFMTVYASNALRFGKTIRTNNEVMCQFTIELYAPYPYFERTVTYSNASSIQNLGDISVGVQATISGSATEPYLRVTGAGAFYLFQGIKAVSNTIIIDTRYGARKLLIDNAVDYGAMSPLYDWIEIPTGAVTISSSGTVDLTFNEAYATMEDL